MCDQDHFEDDRVEYEGKGLVTRRQFGALLGAGVGLYQGDGTTCTIICPLPSGAQRVTVFAGGIAPGARDPEAARGLLRFLASPAASEALRRSGLEPLR